MRSLYESILDDEDMIMDTANIKGQELIRLNDCLDVLHQQIIDLMHKKGDVKGDFIQCMDAPPAYKKGFDIYVSDEKAKSIANDCEKLMNNFYKDANEHLLGELWATHKVGVDTLWYIPEGSYGRQMVYRIIRRRARISIGGHQIMLIKKAKS